MLVRYWSQALSRGAGASELACERTHTWAELFAQVAKDGRTIQGVWRKGSYIEACRLSPDEIIGDGEILARRG